MSFLNNCPKSASLTDIGADNCPVGFGQIVKVYFQRRLNDSGARNAIAAADVATLTTYSTLKSAVDSTKIVVSPLIAGPEFEPGAAIEYGSGNEVPFGIPVKVGLEPTSFTCNLLNQPQSVIKALKALRGEDVAVILVDEFSKLGLEADDYDTPTEYYAIPVQSFSVGDLKPGGHNSPDMNTLTFKLKQDWSDDVKPVSVDFDPISALDD